MNNLALSVRWNYGINLAVAMTLASIVITEQRGIAVGGHGHKKGRCQRPLEIEDMSLFQDSLG